jgi:hypothetical protein
MPRLSAPKISYPKFSDTFYYNSRELPVWDVCANQKGFYYCIPHKKELHGEDKKEEHIEHASTHSLVWYCEAHERFEEV